MIQLKTPAKNEARGISYPHNNYADAGGQTLVRHVLILLCILASLAALWAYQDRRQKRWRAEGKQPFDRSLIGCAVLLLVAALDAGLAAGDFAQSLFGEPGLSLLAAFAGAIFIPIALIIGAAGICALAGLAKPVAAGSAPNESAEKQVQRVPASAFGRPAPAFETVGTWLSMRGNCRNTGWTPALGPRASRVAWRRAAKGVRSAPAVDAHGRVYLPTSSGLIALSPEGEILWSLGRGDAAAPALDREGNVVSAFADRVLIASPDGKASWAQWPEALPGGGPVAVSVAEDGTIFVAARGGVSLESGRVIALGPDGALRWFAKCLQRIEAPPAVSPKGAIYVSSHDTVVWNSDDPSASYDRFQVLSPNGAEIEQTDANDEGYGSTWGPTAALCLEDGLPVVGIGGQIRIQSATFPYRGWGKLALDPEGTLYVSGDGLAAIDLKRGEVKWRNRIEAAETVVDGETNIYVAGRVDQRESVVAIAADGSAAWSWPVPPEDAKYGGWLRGLAIGPDRTLYVATENALFALRG